MSDYERALPAWVRAVVLAAGGGWCTYCGSNGIRAEAVDHVVPLHLGGSHSITNLVPSCCSCNSSKRDRTVLGWRRSIHRRIFHNRVWPNEVADYTEEGALANVRRIQDDVAKLAREHQADAVEKLLRRVALIGMNLQHLTAGQRADVLEAMRVLCDEFASDRVSHGA
ncbi:HNH endonuclease [Streptomyces anulatus]|uniref:HNH endonuclease n=1 Tax=Streptomyces anulatus TaxID=1892 RepID=UPI0033FD0A62